LWILLTLALYFAGRDLPWSGAVASLSRVSPTLIGLAVILNFLILPLWMIEWLLLKPRSAAVSPHRMFEVVTVTASIHNAVPFLAGEAAAIGLLINAGLPRGAALSVLAMDQLLVGVAKLGVLSVAALTAPIPGWLSAGVLSLVGAVLTLLLLLLLLAHFGSVISIQLSERRTRGRAFMARLTGLGTHLAALREVLLASQVFGLAFAKKTLELTAIVAVQGALGMHPSFAASVLILAALAVTTSLPVAPANLGVYEATVFGTYRYLGVDADAALALAIVQHLAFLLPMIATGYVTLTFRQLRAPR
jgi:glycosyltransferase 2 family protein